MAVELAKRALWLHTFTVGAPLSFLDHHLRCGDSLYGERLDTVRTDLNRLGGLFNDIHTTGLLLAAEAMAELNAINDIDQGEVERSRTLMDEAEATLDGLRRVLDLWQARSEEHTSELQSLMRSSYAVFCLKKQKVTTQIRS